MSLDDAFLLIVRWLHLTSAVVWVGGSLFYLLVLRPAIRRAPENPKGLMSAAASEFRILVNLCIVVLLASGVILALDRLTEGVTDVSYAITLGIKSVLSVWMFLLVRSLQRRSALLEIYRESPQPAPTGLRRLLGLASGYNALAILGVVVLFLSDLLNVLFQTALANR